MSISLLQIKKDARGCSRSKPSTATICTGMASTPLSLASWAVSNLPICPSLPPHTLSGFPGEAAFPLLLCQHQLIYWLGASHSSSLPGWLFLIFQVSIQTLFSWKSFPAASPSWSLPSCCITRLFLFPLYLPLPADHILFLTSVLSGLHQKKQNQRVYVLV